MSVQFKVVRRAEPGVAGGGQYKYYASIKRDREVNMRRFVNAIWARSTVNVADVYAVIETFLQLIPEFLLEGQAIDLGPLGKFKVNIRSMGHLEPELVSAHSISNAKLLFVPGFELKEKLSTMRFVKASEEAIPEWMSSGTPTAGESETNQAA
ncbi:MAG: HU family DNA-binding protein [Imperialibacter sp.]|uniref:HU family DNA-binding protein n=1 Tax=Imperialibacter sp. TaxID=2038411 RepID=UPI0032EBD967